MKNYKTIIFLFLILAFSWSCRPSRPEFKPITTQEVEAHIRFLSDDLLEGRAVGSRGLAIAAKHSDLDDFCRRAAENLGFDYIPERSGELGYFFRSDQLSFARAGIPAVWLHEGIV